MARPSKYITHVKPFLDDIKKWSEAGATNVEIAKALGIAESTLIDYKKKYSELSKAFARGRAAIVIDIKAALLKKALGYDYTEEKTIGRKDKSGDKIVSFERIKRHQPPSETAAAMLLRNYDDDWKDKDNATTTLKQQEMELKKAIAGANNFDLDFGDE